MAPKTFAHGWATLSAMDRPRHRRGIVFQRPDDRVLGQELERLLSVGLVCDQPPEEAEAITPVREGRFAGSFELRGGVLLGE
jgi:hypothetical protein